MRLGYVGLDNSHAEQFIKRVNVERPAGLPDDRVTAIWGREPARAAELQAKGKVETVCATPEALLG